MNYETGQAGGSYRWWTLVAIGPAALSAFLDTSIIIVTFPRLTEVLNTSASVVVWLVMAFSIAQLGLLLTFAKIGDTLGRKKIFLYGVVIYTLGLIFCSISPNVMILIISRVVQGVGAAISLTVGTAIVVAVFPQNQQGRAIGWIGMLTSIGLVAGPFLGGVIIEYLDWQGIFYTRIPLAVLTLIMALVIIKEQKNPDARLKLDLSGAATLLVGMCSLLLYFNLGGDWGYLSIPALGFLAIAVIFLGAFIYIENRTPEPVLDLRLFKNRIFSMAALTNLIQIVPASMFPTLSTFFLMDGQLRSSSTVGLLMALIAIPPIILSPISGWISDKIGNRLPMVFSSALYSLALFFASRLNLESTTMQVTLVMLLFGIAMGIFNPPNQSAMVGAAPRSGLSTSLGVSNAAKLLGLSMGIAIAGTLYAQRQATTIEQLAAQGIAPDMQQRLSAVDGFQYVIFLAAVTSVVAIVTSLFTEKKKRP